MPLLRRVIGAVLRRVRQHQGRTLRDVAETAGVSLPYLSEVERGTKEASSEVLAAICRALGLPLPELLDEVRRELLRQTPAPRIRAAVQQPLPATAPFRTHRSASTGSGSQPRCALRPALSSPRATGRPRSGLAMGRPRSGLAVGRPRSAHMLALACRAELAVHAGVAQLPPQRAGAAGHRSKQMRTIVPPGTAVV